MAVVPLLFIGAVVAAFGVLFHTFGQALDADTTGPNLGAGALIAALLGAPFVIWGTVLKYQTVSFQKEGHITDRINKAVEQLGAEKTVKDRVLVHDRTAAASTKRKSPEAIAQSFKAEAVEYTIPNIEVRIGAILSLERIAQDSTRYDKGRDHVRVMEILCAYIRENAPASEAKDHDLGEWEPLTDDAPPEAREGRRAALNERHRKLREWIATLPEPRADIALALQVIGRRDATQRRVEARWGKDADPKAEWVFDIPCPELPEVADDAPLPPGALDRFQTDLQAWKEKMAAYRGYRLDLHKTNLQGADLDGLCLSGAKLGEACMDGAYLEDVQMVSADLDRARLAGANLNRAFLAGAALRWTRMEDANLDRAHLVETDLHNTQMAGASLYQANLVRASFGSATIEGATLDNSKMNYAFLSYARMEQASLVAVRVEGANFYLAKMLDADLAAAWMVGASFEKAHLEGVCFDEAQIDSSTSFTGALVRAASARDIDLTTANLSQPQIDSMFGDGSVTLPESLTRPAHWPTRELDPGEFQTEYAKWRTSPTTYRPPE